VKAAQAIARARHRLPSPRPKTTPASLGEANSGNWQARCETHDRWLESRGEPRKSPAEREQWLREHCTREKPDQAPGVTRAPLQLPTLTEAQLAVVLCDTQAGLCDPEQVRRGAAQLAHECTWYARQAQHYRAQLDRVTEALPDIVARAVIAAQPAPVAPRPPPRSVPSAGKYAKRW
jgi:hypothetical protein